MCVFCEYLCAYKRLKNTNGMNINIGQHRLATQCIHYGLGSALNNKWSNLIKKIWQLSAQNSCVSVYNAHKIKSINNTYKCVWSNFHTSAMGLERDRTNISYYHNDLSTVIAQFHNKTTILFCGDSNAKFGKMESDDSCLGN